jgi:hypothetical protein
MIRRVLLSSGGVLLLLGAGVVAVARAVPTDSASGHSQEPAITVRCAESGLEFKSSADFGSERRVVFGAISVPPSYLPQGVIDSTSAPFSQWFKAGLAIRAGTAAVTVSLPKQWRDRARIVWGAPGTPATALRFERCSWQAGFWNGYSGGFLLRSGPACVPLVFAVGHRRATLRFGVGRRC